MGSLKTTKEKVKEVFDKIGVDPSRSVGEVMEEVGYSESYSKKPHVFKNTQIAKKEYKARFPEKLLEKVHKEGLNATTKKPHLIDRDDKGRPIYDYIEEKDYSTRHKYLDSAYKLRGDYAPEKHQGVVVHTQLSEYLDMIQAGSFDNQKLIEPQAKNAEPVKTTGDISRP